ncbi:MAG TPA: hypothetical protein VGR95_15385 [Thermoanaerobaculia bacterium]|nr:hypothetical protein [Thermoanaerobaculia bacterium]
MTFAYHAQGVGLSASMTRPCCEIIPSLATASLSITGGESYSTVRDYNWKGLISFDEASAYATGNVHHKDDDRVYNTLSTVTVRNLNIANMVHADLVVARVTSEHHPGDPESRITFAGSMIRNLVVGGRPMNVELDETPFTRSPTYEGFSDSFQKLRGQEVEYHDERKQVLSCSLATKVGDTKDFVIHIPEFGRIYVAQVIMKPGYRRISMLRFALGSPIAGSLEVAGGETNGVEYWP